jgi:hypothetical protein
MSAPDYSLTAPLAKALPHHLGASVSAPSLETFKEQIASEFITGSGIDSALFKTAIALVSDTAILPGRKSPTRFTRHSTGILAALADKHCQASVRPSS